MSRELVIRIGLYLAGLVTIPFVVLVLGLAGALPVAATAEPPVWEAALGQSFLAASLAVDAPALATPVAPSRDAAGEADLMAGMRAFRMNCAGCHGDGGAPSVWGTRGFYPRVPQFGVARPQLTPAEMFGAVKNGIRYSGMGAWRDLIGDRQIWQIVNFLDRIDRLPPSVEAQWKRSGQAQ